MKESSMNRIMYANTTSLAIGLICIVFFIKCSTYDNKKGFDGLFRACIRLSVCSGTKESWKGIGKCVNSRSILFSKRKNLLSTVEKLEISKIYCINNSDDCKSVENCINKVAMGEDAYRCQELEDTDLCLENKLLKCFSSEEIDDLSIDCSIAGLNCFERGGLASCAEDVCGIGEQLEHCEGDIISICDEYGFVRYRNCNRPALCDRVEVDNICWGSGTCEEHENGVVECTGDGEECDENSFNPICEGDVAISCRNGRVTQFNCKDFGDQYECIVDQNGEIDCRIGDPECNYMQTREKCEGNRIVFCFRGIEEMLDCQKYGYAGCRTKETGYGRVAYCIE